MIYDQCGEDAIKFIVLEGDYTHLDGTYVNNSEDEKKVDELVALLFNSEEEGGSYKVKLLTKFPHKAVCNGGRVIICGFMP